MDTGIHKAERLARELKQWCLENSIVCIQGSSFHKVRIVADDAYPFEFTYESGIAVVDEPVCTFSLTKVKNI